MLFKVVKYFLLICLFLRLVHAFVAVKIYQRSIYQPQSPCSFIQNVSLGSDASIQTCIWECVHTYDCQTAIYFDDGHICTLFSELHIESQVQSSGNVAANVIAYRKNHSKRFLSLPWTDESLFFQILFGHVLRV